MAAGASVAGISVAGISVGDACAGAQESSRKEIAIKIIISFFKVASV